MKIKIKVNIETFGKYVGYSYNKPDDVGSIDNLINIISCFTDTTKSELYSVDFEDLAKAEESIFNEMKNLKNYDEPKGVVTIDGKDFVFDKTLKTLNVAQMVDIKSLGLDFYNRSPYIMAVLYLNKDVDRKAAEKLFRDDFPIEEYEACCRFFFQKYENWKTITSLIQEIQKMEYKEKESRYGTSTPTAFTRWVRTLIEMWTMLRLCLTVHFYIGKNSFLKKVKRITLNNNGVSR